MPIRLGPIMKYASPEWQETPVLAQIREALREVEHVRNALLAMERNAMASENLHKAGMANRAFASVNQKLGQAGVPGADKLAEAQQKSAGMAGMMSVAINQQHMQQLNGWMQSLSESEMGLRVLLAPHDSGGTAHTFAADRARFLQEQAQKWRSLRKSMNF